MLRGEDVVHGFFMRKLGIDAEIRPERPTEIPVTPAAPGRYVTMVKPFCGSGHGNMHVTSVGE